MYFSKKNIFWLFSGMEIQNFCPSWTIIASALIDIK